MYIKNILDVFSKKIYLIIFILSLLTITFLSSYYLTDYLINPSLRVESNEDEKTVYNESSNYLNKEDILSKWDDRSLTYTRESENKTSSFLPNTYYLGEEDGFISIFKTDNNGAIMQSEKKVYNEYKSINSLPKSDQELIINNKFHYDNKEDALMKLSEMVS